MVCGARTRSGVLQAGPAPLPDSGAGYFHGISNCTPRKNYCVMKHFPRLHSRAGLRLKCNNGTAVFPASGGWKGEGRGRQGSFATSAAAALLLQHRVDGGRGPPARAQGGAGARLVGSWSPKWLLGNPCPQFPHRRAMAWLVIFQGRPGNHL